MLNARVPKTSTLCNKNSPGKKKILKRPPELAEKIETRDRPNTSVPKPLARWLPFQTRTFSPSRWWSSPAFYHPGTSLFKLRLICSVLFFVVLIVSPEMNLRSLFRPWESRRWWRWKFCWCLISQSRLLSNGKLVFFGFSYVQDCTSTI